MPRGRAGKMDRDDFIAAASEKHKNADGSPIYNYNQVIYVNSVTPVSIICRQHGVFAKTPSKHIHSQGCPTCGRIRGNTNRKQTQEDEDLVLQNLEDMSDYEELSALAKVSP